MTDRSRPLLAVQALIASLLILTGLGTASAAAEKRIQFNIVAQDLASALNEFARQSAQELLFSTDLAASKRTSGIVGEFAPTDALKALLQGTGLRYRVNNDNTILIEKGDFDSAWRAGSPSPYGERALTLGQPQDADTPPPSGSPRPAASGSAVDTSRDSLEQVLEEVVVTGSWIRGVQPAGSPLTTYTRDDIELTGAATLEQFARYMPQNFGSVDTSSGRATSVGPGQSGGNSNAGAGFNLHGVGPVATLTLLNGRRLAPAGDSGAFVDVSMIPLAAVDHIDVLTDGASALYGADAIAGVVNVVLRNDFEGAQTSARYGFADGGAEELTGSQLLGTAWNSGNALLVYEHDGRQPLFLDEREFLPPQPVPEMLVPAQSRNSFLVNGRQELGPTTALSLDAYLSDRNARQEISFFGFESRVESGVESSGGTLALAQELPAAWRLDVNATASWLDQESVSVFPLFAQRDEGTADTELMVAGIRADGPLFAWRAGSIRGAIGADFRKEKFETVQSSNIGGVQFPTATIALERDVKSVVAELHVPLVDTTMSIPGIRQLEMSIAGRHDDYEDIGSSTNPKVGLLWSPTTGFNVRASYGTAFHAPLLRQVQAQRTHIAITLPNPAAPSGFTNTLLIDGSSRPDLEPETARSLTAGIELAPAAVPGFRFVVTYFDLEFTDRIALPPAVGGAFAVWNQPDVLAPFINSSPDLALRQAIFASPFLMINISGLTPETVEAIYDNRIDNMAETQMSGVDAAITYQWRTGFGNFGVALSGAHILNNDFQSAVSVPSVSLNDQLGSPVDLRMHGALTWTNGPFGSALLINHIDSYSNRLVTPEQDLASWTTMDLQLRYSGSAAGGLSALDGFDVTLMATNIGDKRPPRLLLPAGPLDPGYDAANANALGRVVSLQLTKSW